MTAPTITPAAVQERLRATSFLDGFPDAYFWRLARAVTPQLFPAGEALFQEGDPRRFFAILTDGSIAIDKAGEGGGVRLVTMGPGEAVGEGLLLGDTDRHGTTARALTDVQALVMTREQLDDLVKEHPALYAALVARAARAIAQRLRSADATLVGRGR